MAVIPWRAPAPNDPGMAYLLTQVNEAQRTLDRAVAEALALPDAERSRVARLARYSQLQREVQRTYDQVTRLARGWATTDIPSMYAEGHLAAALQMRTGGTFTLAHKEAVTRVVDDAYDDVATGLQQVSTRFNQKIAAQKQLELLSDDRRGLIQLASRDLVAQQLILGELSPADAARRLRNKLWESGVEIIDRRGRLWNPEAYSRMLIRTKSANAFNVGTLNKFRTDGISRVLVFDGTHDPDCARANGQIWTMDYAYSHIISHPNCRRAFAPQPGRGVLHRATLDEVARFGALAVVDELAIAVFLRTIRRWNAVGKIELAPPPVRDALDRFEFTIAALEHLEYAEAWATEQFMPAIERIGDLTAPGMVGRLKDAATERLERRARPVKEYALQLMAEDPKPILATDPQSQRVRSAAATIRQRLGTDQIADIDRLLDPVRGVDDDIDDLIEKFEEELIQLFELTDAMRAHGGAGMYELAALLDEADEADVLGLMEKHFTINTQIGGGANGTIPVIRIDGVEYIVKHVNASVSDVWPGYVAEEWTTYLARKLGLPRLDTALVRIDDGGETGIIVQPYASGWSTPNELMGRGHKPYEVLLSNDDVGRRMSLLDILVANSDQHDNNWLISARRQATDQELRQARIMMIDMETAFGVPWPVYPNIPEGPPHGATELVRGAALRPRPRAGPGRPWENSIEPGVTPAEYSDLYHTVRLTPQEDEFLRAVLRGEHDDALIRIAGAIPEEDLARLPATYLNPQVNPDRPWQPLVERKIEQIKSRIRRAYAVGYVDDGTRTMEFAGRQVTVGDVERFDLLPESTPVGFRGPQNPLRVVNSTPPPELDFMEGIVWNVWQDEDGTRWIAIAHGLPTNVTPGPQQTGWRGFKVLREQDVVAGTPAPPVPVSTKVQLTELGEGGEVGPIRIVHDWVPPTEGLDLTDLERETGIDEILGVLENAIDDTRVMVLSELEPSEIRLARIDVDGVEIPGAYHPRGAEDHEYLQELANVGGVVVNPEKLLDGLEGFWEAWKGGRAEDAVDALDTSRFERVLRHELGHAIAENRAQELTDQAAEIAFRVITEDEEWMRTILGPNVEAAEAVRLLTPQQLRAAVQPEVDRYVERVTQKIQATLRDEVRRVMQETYGVTRPEHVGRLPEWLRYAGNVFTGQHPGLDPLREFEGDLFAHLLERGGRWDELSRLEKLFALQDLPDLPRSMRELNELEDWLQEWFADNRLPSIGLQLMAEQTGLSNERVKRVTEFQNVAGEITEEAMIRRVYEHDFGDFQSKVYDIKESMGLTRVRGTIEIAPGVQAGTFDRKLIRNPDGTVTIDHSSLFINDQYQGRGIGTRFFEWTEDWYVAKGVKEIRVDTVQVGGYNWARQHYKFRDPTRAVAFLRPGHVINGGLPTNPTPEAVDAVNDVLMRTWLRDEQFVNDHLTPGDAKFSDLWRFTERVKDGTFHEVGTVTEQRFRDEIGEGDWTWYGVQFGDAVRAKELYEVVSTTAGFKRSLASEALRWMTMGALPLRTKDLWATELRRWEALIKNTFKDELEVYRRRTARAYELVEDRLQPPERRFLGIGGAITSVREAAQGMIEKEWTPFRLSQIGNHAQFEVDGRPTWVGKQMMLGAYWEGIKPLEALRKDYRTRVFGKLTDDEVMQTTPIMRKVDRTAEVEHLIRFADNMVARLEGIEDEFLVVRRFEGDPDKESIELYERIGDEVRFLKRVLHREVDIPRDDDEMVDWARNIHRSTRRSPWLGPGTGQIRTLDDWNELRTQGIVFDNTDEITTWERHADVLRNALADPSQTVRDAKLLNTLIALNGLAQEGVPGVGTAVDWVHEADMIRRIFDAVDGQSGHVLVGDVINPHMYLNVTSSTLPTGIPSDQWARGTMVREYAGATTYYAINSQMRRERGVHNMSLAMQRALRRDYDAGPPYSLPGWGYAFRQTSLPHSFWESLEGDEFISESYMSTAYTPGGIGGFASGPDSSDVMIMVRLPEELQHHARFVNGAEQEVLFAPGSRFAVRATVDTHIPNRAPGRFRLVVMDYLGTLDRDVPAFGGWRNVRFNFQYVSNIGRGESVRYRLRPGPTLGRPDDHILREGIVVGVTPRNVSMVEFENGRLSGRTIVHEWTNIFEMQAARAVATDPPVNALPDQGFRVIDLDEFEDLFAESSDPTINIQQFINRTNHPVRFELQTGQLVEAYIVPFAGAVTDNRIVTTEGIFELGAIRRLQVSENAVPATRLATPADDITNLLHLIEAELSGFPMDLHGRRLSPQRLAYRFRDFAKMIEDNPNIMQWATGLVGEEDRLFIHAMLGGLPTEFSMQEFSNMEQFSRHVRPMLMQLARSLDRFDGMGAYDQTSTLIGPLIPRFLRRMADVLEHNGVATPVVNPVTGVPKQIKLATAKVITMIEDAFDVGGETYQINVEELVENIQARANEMAATGWDDQITHDTWFRILTGDQLLMGTDAWDEHVEGLADLANALNDLGNHVAAQMAAGPNVAPVGFEVLQKVADYLNDPSVIQLPMDVNKIGTSVVDLLNEINLEPHHIVTAIEQNLGLAGTGTAQTVLQQAITALKEEVAVDIGINLAIDDPSDDPTLQLILDTFGKLWDKVNQAVMAKAMLTPLELVDWLNGLVPPLGPVVVDDLLVEFAGTADSLTNAMSALNINDPSLIADVLKQAVSDNPNSPMSNALEQIFINDDLNLLDSFTSDEMNPLLVGLTDAVADMNGNVGTLIALLEEMALQVDVVEVEVSDFILEALTNAIDSADLEPQFIASALSSIHVDSPLSPAMSVVEKMFEIDALGLVANSIDMSDQVGVFNTLVDALNDSAVDMNILKLIQLLEEMAG